MAKESPATFPLASLLTAEGLGQTLLGHGFRAEKRSAQASAHPLSQAQGGLFCVLTACVDCVRQFVCLSLREF